MRISRTATTAAVTVQIVLIGLWTWAQSVTFRGLIDDARLPGAENYAPSIVISGAFLLALLAVLIGCLYLWFVRTDNLNILVRIEIAIVGLAIITGISNQSVPSWPVVAVAIIAALLAAVAIRTRFE